MTKKCKYQQKEEQQVVPNTTAAPQISTETHLPRGIMIIESLSNSFFKVCLGIILISFAGIFVITGIQWAKGEVSTDMFIKIIVSALEALQNLIIV